MAAAKKKASAKKKKAARPAEAKASRNSELAARIVELERQVMVAERLRFESLRGKPVKGDGSFNASTFVAGVAHEFNNILGAADGHAEWALESGDPKEMREALEVVRLACRRSSQITQGLQGLFQPREESKVLFPLKNAFAELLRIFGARAKKENVEFTIKSVDAQVYGDPVRILEVFVNLAKNSFEVFAARKLRAPQIDIEVKAHPQRKNFLVMRFGDNGPGVPEIYRELLFQPFFTTKGTFSNTLPDAESQLPPQDNTPSGSGLGLYLSRQIIEEHGGTLTYRDQKQGACFEITLPLAR